MGDKLKKAIKEKDYLRAKRLIMDNPKYLEENVDCVLDMVKVLSEPIRFADEPLSEERKDELYRRMKEEMSERGKNVLTSWNEFYIDGVNKSGMLGEDNIIVPVEPTMSKGFLEQCEETPEGHMVKWDHDSSQFAIEHSRNAVFQTGSERISNGMPVEDIRERKTIRVFDRAESGGDRAASLLIKDGKVVCEVNTDLNDIDIEDDGQ